MGPAHPLRQRDHPEKENPFVASWTANVSKSKIHPSSQFKSTTLQTAVAGDTVTMRTRWSMQEVGIHCESFLLALLTVAGLALHAGSLGVSFWQVSQKASQVCPRYIPGTVESEPIVSSLDRAVKKWRRRDSDWSNTLRINNLRQYMS
jgi:hypothetical protein